MGKVSKPKGGAKANPRSRAARRATSPSLDTDKSLKSMPRASDATSVLSAHRGGGILKKRKVKQLTRGQRVRHARGLERAEIVRDQHDSKVTEAKQRSKKTQTRRSDWEDINDASKEETRKTIKAPGRFDVLDDEAEVDNIEPFAGDTEIKMLDGVQVPAFAAGTKMTMTLGPPGLGGLSMGKPKPTSQHASVDEIT